MPARDGGKSVAIADGVTGYLLSLMRKWVNIVVLGCVSSYGLLQCMSLFGYVV